MRLRTARLALVAAAAVVGTLGSSGSSLAGEPAAGALLTVDRPADARDCADARALAAAVARVRGRDALDTDPSSRATVRLDVSFARLADGYSATMQVSGARAGARTLADRARSCEALTGAVAAALVVMVDAIDVTPPSTTPAPSADPAPNSTTASFVPAFNDMPPVDPPAAQTRAVVDVPARHAVFFELGGPSILYSLNYEHFLLDGRLGLRVGAAFLPAFDAPSNGVAPVHVPAHVAFPAVASWYFGGPRVLFQLGAGATSFASRWGDAKPAILPVLVWGGHFVPRGRGFDFGWGFTPLFGATGSNLPLGCTPTGGISFGARF
jgi:hypothetical protein